MPKVRIKRGREKSIKQGYLWVHPDDIGRISPSARDGGQVDVVDSKERLLGRGIFNSRSPMVVRIFSHKREDWDEGLIASRLEEAMERRRNWGLDLSSCRLVYGESDLLPGLIVDRYGPVLVIQLNHPAWEGMRESLAKMLMEMTDVSVVYEKSDTPSRATEGLEPRKGILCGEGLPSEILIREGDLEMRVDVERGQKTGHFLDQKENRLKIRTMAEGRRTLDLFCYTGGFGLQALAGGAKNVTFVDSSGFAIQQAKHNVWRCGWSERAHFVQANAFDFLREVERRGELYEMVCIDPPALATSKKAIPNASRGYKELNLRALRLLAKGGILVSSSCSTHLPVGLHLQLITEAARDAKRQLLLLHQWGQGLDHPVLPGHPPSRYLKCHVLQVLKVLK